MKSVKENISLKTYNTFNIDVAADYFIELTSVDDISNFVLKELKKYKKYQIIGGGSNLLFTSDYEGIIISPQIKGVQVRREDEHSVLVEAGAGEDWDSFVGLMVKEGYGGIENLSLIPGNVGATPIQNIGAYGVEVKDVIEYVNFVEIETGKVKTLKADECAFGYRDSIFKNKLKNKIIVTSVVFRFMKNNYRFRLEYGNLKDRLTSDYSEVTLENIRNAVIKIREEKLPDPEVIGNAGSFFKNPVVNIEHYHKLLQLYPEVPSYKLNEAQVKIPAAYLIEKSGFKGIRNNDAGVHQNQPLVLVNYGNANGKEILELANQIIQKVNELFNIKLTPEVNVIS